MSKTKGGKILYWLESLKNGKSDKIIFKGIASITWNLAVLFSYVIGTSCTTRGRLELSKYSNAVASMMEGSSWHRKLREQDTLHKDCFAKPSPSSVYPHGVPCMNTNSLWPVFDIKTTVGWLLVSWLSMMEGKESWFKIGSHCDTKRKKPTKAGVWKTVLEIILS